MKLKEEITPEDFGINAEDAQKARDYADYLVAAERERCAKIADDMDYGDGSIARCIRSGP